MYSRWNFIEKEPAGNNMPADELSIDTYTVTVGRDN